MAQTTKAAGHGPTPQAQQHTNPGCMGGQGTAGRRVARAARLGSRSRGLTLLVALLLSAACQQDAGHSAAPRAGTGEDPAAAMSHAGASVEPAAGASAGGATDNGATDNGATDNGATDNGATDNGATDNGATDDGSAANSPAANGAADNEIVAAQSGAGTSPGDDESNFSGESPGLVLRLVEPADGPAASGSNTDPAASRDPPGLNDPLNSNLGEPLDADAAQALLSRAPALTADTSATVPFRFPSTTKAPPRAGTDRQLVFPPAGESTVPSVSSEAPLALLRYQPEGEVAMASHLSLTFSEPMVPLGTVDDVALPAEAVPVLLAPQPPGTWRWIDTRTLVFEPETRFAYATHHRVEVAKGLSSALGSTLPASASWRFSTAAPNVIDQRPWGESLPLQPLIALAFDQPVRGAEVLAHARLTREVLLVLDTEQTLRLAEPGELASDDGAQELIARYGAERVVVLAATEPLSRDSSLVLEIADGVQGAEGPRRSEQPWRHAYKTFAPLTIVRHAGTADRPLSPHGWLTIDCNNPLDEETVTTETVSIAPSVPGLHVTVQGRRLLLRGDFRGQGRFEVTLGEDIGDLHGQTLQGGRELTIHVDPLPPSFTLAGGGMQVLDPGVEPSLDLTAWNVGEVRLDVSRVTAAQWPLTRAWSQGHRNKEPIPQVGELLTSVTLDLSADLDATVEKTLGLASLLDGNPGQLLLRSHWHDGETMRSDFSWVQSTELGLHAALDGEQLLVWVTDLADGTPQPDVEVSLQGADTADGLAARTDAGGLARLPLSGETPSVQWLVARRGDDVALLPENRWIVSHRTPSQWVARDHGVTPLFYVFDDRGLYKPGEEVRVKGWVRQVSWKKGGQTTSLPNVSGRFVGWRLRDARWVERAQGTAQLDAFGGFDLSCVLPDDLNLGQATIEFALDDAGLSGGSVHGHSLQIQEFRLPEYEVSVTASPGAVVLGDDVQLVAEALYYTGGALPDAPVSWSLDAEPTTHAPPGWPGFSFGEWHPWWGYGSYDGWGGASGSSSGHWDWTAATDASGRHRLTAELLAMNPPQPMRLSVEAAVTDVNFQRWAGTASVLVHPSEHALGLRTERGFVELGDPLALSFVVVDLDGLPVSDRDVSLVATRREWGLKDGTWVEEEVARIEVAAVSESAPVSVELMLTEGGSWTLTARCFDGDGRPYISSRSVWVSGGESRPSRALELEELTLISDKASYEPGDLAEVLVVAPHGGGSGLYTLRRDGVVSSGSFVCDGSDHTLRLPISAAYCPEVELSVEWVGSAVRTESGGTSRPDQPTRPAYAAATITLSVPPEAQRLQVLATPAATELPPGSETSVEVAVLDAQGGPVAGAQVALVVVDEAVLAMTRRELADPLGVFHPTHPGRTSDYRSRDMVHLSDPDIEVPKSFGAMVDRFPPSQNDDGSGEGGADDYDGGDAERLQGLRSLGYMGEGDYAEAPMAMARKARGFGGDAADDGAGPAIRLRTNFDVLAAFVPAVVTDGSGRAQIPITLPDRLTRYRILALAVEGDGRAGMGESALTARLPLMVRPSPPRFLNVGDSAELPLVVHNRLDEDLLVDVGLGATGLDLGEAANHSARRVLVPARDRVEVRFEVSAHEPGEARLSAVVAAVLSPELADGARAEFPVLTPATAEAFATYGHLDDDLTVQPLRPPTDALPGFGGLELTFATTALAELTDAVIQLATYPYQCAEQRASRVMAMAALGDVLAAFDAAGLPDEPELDGQVREDIEQLSALQNSDGGWSFWRKDERSDPYLSVHVTQALLLAQQAGADVPEEALQRGLAYVFDLRAHLNARTPRMPAPIAQVIRAYGLSLLHRAGHDVADDAHDLLRAAALDDWPLDGLGWLLPVLAADPSLKDDVAQVHRQLSNRVVETASTAHFVEGYDQAGELVLAASRRGDAVVLDGLLASRLDEDLQPKLVRGLLSHRVAGRWHTTQESVFALLALSRYFALHEGQTPDLTAGLWMGEQLVAEEDFAGRTSERRNVLVPLDALNSMADDDTVDLTVASAGPGRLYWRMGLAYASLDLSSESVSAGFTVEREYEALDDPGDVARDEQGGWVIRRGARVAVRLTLVNTSRRFHVALVDRLPGGFEILNSAFAITGAVPETEQALDPGVFWRCWFWGRQWYDHENLRDAQAEVFALGLSPGVHRYSYVARATTPGSYVVPPAKAEEMYAPETFGRSDSARVLIE